MTGNDSWDVTTNLGTTALGVAAQRAAETAQDDPLFRDEFAAVLVAAVEEPGWQMMASGDLSWMGPEDDNGRRAATSGRDYVASRTVHFDDFLAAAVTAGIRQVVILAAGLDARSYRLNSLSGVVVYEVDQPNVLGFKHTVLRAHGAVPVADMRAVPVDLRDDEWPSALSSAGFDASAPTAWLVEGLLPYLSSADQEHLFDRVLGLSAEGSCIAADAYPSASTHLSEDRMSSWRHGAAEMRDKIGVAMDVAAYIKHEDLTDIADWLARRGWIVEALDSRELMARLGRALPADLIGVLPISSLITATMPPGSAPTSP